MELFRRVEACLLHLGPVLSESVYEQEQEQLSVTQKYLLYGHRQVSRIHPPWKAHLTKASVKAYDCFATILELLKDWQHY